MPRFMIWFGLIFATVGVATGTGAFFAWSSAQTLVEQGVRTQGTVIGLRYVDDDDGSGTYAPIVEFVDRTGQRQVYRSNASSNPPSYDRGETVTLYYMPDTPERAMIDSFTDRWMLPLILGIFGVVFGGVGFGVLFLIVRRKIIVKRLKRHGMTISADFERTFLDSTIKVNGRSPWRVVAKAIHPGTGRIKSFESRPIWVDLREELQGKSVPVLVDPNRPKDHYVDLSHYIDD